MKAPLENLEARMPITKMPTGAWVSYTADKTSPWMADLLKEMNENASSLLPANVVFAQSSIELKIELMKKFKGEIGEYVLAKGTIDATYATECVRSLKPMQDKLHAEFKTCFVPLSVTESEEYAETDEIWLDGDTWEMYPFSKNQVDISEMVHEQAYLNYNYYPRLDAEGTDDADLSSDN